MRFPTLILIASGLAFGSSAALAQAGAPMPIDPQMTNQPERTFEDLDTNRDGQIAKAEVPIDHELNTLFANFDSNGDLKLSRVEFDAYAEAEEEEAE